MYPTKEVSHPGSGSAQAGFARFCADTSLHGWKYCNREDGFGLAVWLLVIVASMSSAAYMVTINCINFYRATVSFNLESPTDPLDSVFFPSAVICNMNALRRSFLSEIIRDPDLQHLEYPELFRAVDDTFIKGKETTGEQVDIVELLLSSQTYDRLFTEFLEATEDDFLSASAERKLINTNTDLYIWHDIHETFNITEENLPSLKRAFLPEVAAQFRDGQMMPAIEFRGWGIFYETGFSTDMSENCVWLTPYVRENKEPYELRLGQPYCKMGANNGMVVLLDAETYDYASSPATSAEGFTLSLLHHLDIPIMKQSGISVDPGQSLQVSVTPTITTTTDAAKRRFRPVDRTCYFEEEIKLRHFPLDGDYRYEMSNCLFEATLQEIERSCGCTPKNFLDVVDGFEPCAGTGKRCMNEHLQDMGDVRTIDDDGVEKPCLASCDDLKYHVLVTQSSYPNEHTFRQTHQFCVLVEKLERSCRGARRVHLERRYPSLCRLLDSYSDEAEANPTNATITCDPLQSFLQNFNGREEEEAASNPDDGDGDGDGDGDLLSDLQDAVTAYARDNVAIVTVFIRDLYAAHYVRDEKIPEIAFVGTVGGLLGLFLGFSFVSIIEFVYLCMGRKRGRSQSSPSSLKSPSFSSSTSSSGSSAGDSGKMFIVGKSKKVMVWPDLKEGEGGK